MTWLTARPVRSAALAVFLLSASAAMVAGVQLMRVRALDAQIAAQSAGAPPAVPENAPPALLAAHARALLRQGGADAAQAIADRLAAGPVQEALLYDIANAHMRKAFAIFTQVPFKLVRPLFALAKADYRRALQLRPDDWDARYNYAIAASFIRETETSSPSAGDEMAHERAAWPDMPGAPNGMP